MPSINPLDYNIDKFNSQNLGPISVEGFRDFILKHNLTEPNPEVVESGINNNTINTFIPFLFNPNPKIVDLPNLNEVSFVPSVYNNETKPRPDNIQKNQYTNQNPFFGSSTEEISFVVNKTNSLTGPGTIDTWLEEGGFNTDVFTLRNFIQLKPNEFGPEELFDWSGSEQPLKTTGFLSYPSINPLQPNNIISEVVLRTLGFSSTSFIDFPSQLEDIAKERRLFEIESRVKLNFANETIGLLNLNTTQLLLGNGLITADYVITRPPGLFSRVANFTSNLTGFNIPVSILPGPPNTKITSNFFQTELLRFTGRAQKNLIYFNAYSSKYSSPLLSKGLDDNDPDSSGGILQNIRNFFKDLGREQTSNYLTIAETEEDSGGDSLASRIGKFFNDLISPEVDPTLVPTNEKSTNPLDPFTSMGVNGEFPSIETMDDNSLFNNKEMDGSEFNGPYKTKNTKLSPLISDGDGRSISKTFDWRSRPNVDVAKRGLLKYTQDMVNSAKSNNNQGAARFIGCFDDDSNLVNVNGKQRHSTVSKGNLVRNGDNSAYCRSWSNRNPYQNHDDLIRSDRLYKLKNKTNYLSVLEDNGHVKIAPYNSDDFSEGSVDPKRYMFSIENLAWLDAPELLALPNCEVGPNGGRIMWFPPYEISFTDNTTANWDSTNFIGRSEPIYTYNHTERKGTLTFKVITDHPSVLQKMKQKTEEEIHRFFAGCGLDLEELFPTTIIQEVIEEVVETIDVAGEPTTEEQVTQQPQLGDESTPNTTPPRKDPPFKELKVYFENARRDNLVGGVRSGVGRNVVDELNRGYEIPGKNNDVASKIMELSEFLATEEGQNWGVEFIGYTSKAAPNDYNKVLSIDRATSVFTYTTEIIKNLGQSVSGFTYIPENFTVGRIGYVCKSGDKCNQLIASSKCFPLNPNISCYPDLDISDVPQPVNDLKKSELGRFIINARGEDYAQSTEGENPNNPLPISERYVKIKLFKNENWLLNNTTPKLSPKRIDSILGGLNDEILPLTPLTNDTTIVLGEQSLDSKLTLMKLTQQQRELQNQNERRKRLEDDRKNVDVGETENDEVNEEIQRRVIERTVDKLFTECDYFEKIKKEDPFLYDKISEKIKFFHPSFHSTSPEGFNSRLNFLHQCMRQGPNVRPDETRVRNMAFGRPPVCILRLGDFYYTRIIIDSLNITYEPLVWDMNPEGIGVQPMIANVDLNFSIIGGSSLSGPITQLQNAVSFNYFANTSVYNPARIVNTKLSGFYKTLEQKLTEESMRLTEDEIIFGSYESEESFQKFGNSQKPIRNVITPKDGDQINDDNVIVSRT